MYILSLGDNKAEKREWAHRKRASEFDKVKRATIKI